MRLKTASIGLVRWLLVVFLRVVAEDRVELYFGKPFDHCNECNHTHYRKPL